MATSTPKQFLSPTHFNVVALETFFTPLPELSVPTPHTFSLVEYSRTTVDEIPARIKDADILITTTLPLRADNLSEAISPRLKFIAVVAAGTDSIDLEACAARGITVLNSPNCNADAVAEHAIALYFATRRSIIPSMSMLRAGEWKKRGTLMKSIYMAAEPPRSCCEETAVVIGHGNVGKKVATLCSQLGMKVVIAGRKGASSVPEDRVAFDEALKMATVVVLCCPRTPETLSLLSAHEFSLMKRDSILINVARGGVVNENELLTALKDGFIAGAGVDVYEKEPATAETSPLLTVDTSELNLVTTPHTAWIGSRTTANYQVILQKNMDEFISKNTDIA